MMEIKLSGKFAGLMDDRFDDYPTWEDSDIPADDKKGDSHK